MAWVALTQATSSWIPLSEDAGDWLGLGLTPLLTDDGMLLFSEGAAGPLCIEASAPPPRSNWVPL